MTLGITSSGIKGFVQRGFEECAARTGSLVQAKLQLVADRHELIHLGNDAALFGERRKR
jgi:hypothetical protein